MNHLEDTSVLKHNTYRKEDHNSSPMPTFSFFSNHSATFCALSQCCLTTKVQGLKTNSKQIWILRCRNTSKVSHQLVTSFVICQFTKPTSYKWVHDNSHQELSILGTPLTICFPIKVTRIDNNTTNLWGMSIHILCRRMSDDITTPLKRTTVDWCSKCIVNYQWYTMLIAIPAKRSMSNTLPPGLEIVSPKKHFVFGWKAASIFHHPTQDQWRYTQYPTLQCYTKEIIRSAIDCVGSH